MPPFSSASDLVRARGRRARAEERSEGCTLIDHGVVPMLEQGQRASEGNKHGGVREFGLSLSGRGAAQVDETAVRAQSVRLKGQHTGRAPNSGLVHGGNGCGGGRSFSGQRHAAND